VESWLTEDEYLDARECHLLAWQDSPDSPRRSMSPGKPTLDVSVSVVDFFLYLASPLFLRRQYRPHLWVKIFFGLRRLQPQQPLQYLVHLMRLPSQLYPDRETIATPSHPMSVYELVPLINPKWRSPSELHRLPARQLSIKVFLHLQGCLTVPMAVHGGRTARFRSWKSRSLKRRAFPGLEKPIARNRLRRKRNLRRRRIRLTVKKLRRKGLSGNELKGRKLKKRGSRRRRRQKRKLLPLPLLPPPLFQQ
jgi:hypothetical protein